MLKFGEITDGIQPCELDISLLYADPDDRAASRGSGRSTWAAIPPHPSCGGPATRSSTALSHGSERSERIARLCYCWWGIRRLTQWLLVCVSRSREAGESIGSGSLSGVQVFWSSHGIARPRPHSGGEEQIRKQVLFRLDDTSPFRIGIGVDFSLPSAASDLRWSGVSGLRRLSERERCAYRGQENERIGDLVRGVWTGR